MDGKHTSVFGIYANRSAAELAVDQLNQAGFTNDDISVLLSDTRSSEQFAHQKSTKAPEGATTGATAGGAIGGTLGLLAGIGMLAIPGVGPLIAAGPIMAALAGLGVGGAVGGVIGALVGMGIPEYEAKRYEGRIKDGGILLSVHCDTSEEITRAKDLLKQTGADDISSSKEESADSHTESKAEAKEEKAEAKAEAKEAKAEAKVEHDREKVAKKLDEDSRTVRFTNDRLVDEDYVSREYPPDTLNPEPVGVRTVASDTAEPLEIERERKVS